MVEDILTRAEEICMDLRAREYTYKDHPNAGVAIDISAMAKDSADIIEDLIRVIKTKE